MALLIAFFTLILAFIPEPALAWGIGVHLQIGSHILANLQLLPPALQTLLTTYPHDFLYGCISADITLGKKYTHYLQHCHSWRMGKNILEAARTNSQRACAYGYLGHLAADTVAHSYFVPFKMVRSFNTVMLKHTYWEIRFEAHIDPEIWTLARTIARKDFAENDALLRSVLSDTIFSFKTNKRIFNSMLLLNRLQQWQKMLRSLAISSKWTISEVDREDYLGLARTITESILGDLEQSPYWKADPTGERAINAAKMIRKNLNLLWLDGKLPEREAEEILAQLKPRFREGITSPDRLLELLSVI
ncbi:zinc dependent phospholipase C family protein [Desulfuromonas versatilis]|nr:zinc dependent phospholipase C family protein [Desulfuromonas versatilis]